MRASLSAAPHSPLVDVAGERLGLLVKPESRVSCYSDEVHLFGPAVALQASATA